MKSIYFFMTLLLLAGLNGEAQLTLTKASNEPVSGDVHIMVSHDSTTVVQRNNGTGQLWNFTSFASNNFTEAITYTTAASVPESSMFPGATIAAKRGANNTEFFMSSGSDWYFMGDYKTPSGELFVLNNTALFMSYPVSVSNTFSDIATGFQVVGSTSTALTGTLSYHASGTGTVMLPGGVIHNNCLQMTNTLTVITGTGSGSITMTQINYVYYSASKKFPVAEIQYNERTGQSGTTKEFSAFFDREIATGLNELTIQGSFDLYPNPAGDLLTILLPSDFKGALIEVMDEQGRVVMSEAHTSVLDVASLPSGVYLIAVSTVDKRMTRRMVIHR